MVPPEATIHYPSSSARYKESWTFSETTLELLTGLSLCRQLQQHGFVSTAVLTSPVDSDLLWFSLICDLNLLLPFLQEFLSLGGEVWRTCLMCVWALSPHLLLTPWLVVSFSVSHHLLHQGTSLMGSERCTDLWVKRNKSRKQETLCPFGDTLVGSLLGPIHRLLPTFAGWGKFLLWSGP